MWQEFVPAALRKRAEILLTGEQRSKLLALARDVLDDLLPRRSRIRLELRAPLLYYLPWEFVPFMRALPPELATYPARFTPPPRFDARTLPLDQPLRVLFVSASPERSKTRIDGGEELARLEQALSQVARGLVEVVPLLNADTHKLAATLAEQQAWFHVLDFVGHGLSAASGPLLALESEKRSQFLSAAELGDLARLGGVRLLTLQTPSRTSNYQIAAFTGIASRARALGLPATLFDLRTDTKEVPDIARVYAGIAAGLATDIVCLQASLVDPDESSRLALNLHTRSERLFERQVPLTQEMLNQARRRLDATLAALDSDVRKLLGSGAPAGQLAGALLPLIQDVVSPSFAGLVCQALAEELDEQNRHMKSLLDQLGEGV